MLLNRFPARETRCWFLQVKWGRFVRFGFPVLSDIDLAGDVRVKCLTLMCEHPLDGEVVILHPARRIVRRA